MGIRSSWEAMCAVMQGTATEAVAEGVMDERRLKAARRHWRVEYALMQMGAPTLHMVRLVAEDPLHVARAGFGEFGNIAHYTAAAEAARDLSRTRKRIAAFVDRLGMRLATGKAGRAEQIAAKQIRDDTETVLEIAQREYHHCLRKVKR
jgi:hypothetical protein